jgi:hypothetical protein
MKYLIILFLFVAQFLQADKPDRVTTTGWRIDACQLARVIGYDCRLDP